MQQISWTAMGSSCCSKECANGSHAFLIYGWTLATTANKGKGKDWVEKELGLTAEIVRHPPKPRYVWAPEGEEPDWDDLRARGLLPEPGFKVLPRRWVVERSFSWVGHNRRMSKDYERLPETGEAFMYVAMTRLMLRRLTRT